MDCNCVDLEQAHARRKRDAEAGEALENIVAKEVLHVAAVQKVAYAPATPALTCEPEQAGPSTSGRWSAKRMLHGQLTRTAADVAASMDVICLRGAGEGAASSSAWTHTNETWDKLGEADKQMYRVSIVVR